MQICFNLSCNLCALCHPLKGGKKSVLYVHPFSFQPTEPCVLKQILRHTSCPFFGPSTLFEMFSTIILITRPYRSCLMFTCRSCAEMKVSHAPWPFFKKKNMTGANPKHVSEMGRERRRKVMACLFLVSGSNKSFLLPASGLCARMEKQ